MKKLLNILAVSLVAIAVQPASAQVVPGASPQTSDSNQVVSPSLEGGVTSLNEFVLVRGTPEEIDNLRRPPSGPRFMERGDDLSVMTRQQWRARGWSDESFQRAGATSRSFCGRTAEFTARTANLMQRYAAAMPHIASLRDRYLRMARQIQRAGTIRTGTNIFSAAVGFLVNPVYGVLTTLGAVGNEAQGRAHTNSSRLANDAGMLNNELTGMHVEFNMMSLEMYTEYLGLINGYCTTTYGGNASLIS